MPIVVASTNRDVTSATHLWSCSSTRGTSIITAAPTSGANTATLGPQCLRRSSICPFSSLQREDQDAGQDHGAAEEQRAVLLDLAGLQLAQDLAGELRAGP